MPLPLRAVCRYLAMLSCRQLHLHEGRLSLPFGVVIQGKMKSKRINTPRRMQPTTAAEAEVVGDSVRNCVVSISVTGGIDSSARGYQSLCDFGERLQRRAARTKGPMHHLRPGSQHRDPEFKDNRTGPDPSDRSQCDYISGLAR